MERALAHIEKVEWIRPIEGADNIELIGVLGWVCIAKRGEFKTGDLAVYIEIDSLAPKDDERFAFLESKKYKIKTMKLGKFKVISQGLALPASLFPEVTDCKIGDDVTEKLKITYYSDDDRQRKSSSGDPNEKYKRMSKRNPKLFKNPIIRKIMKTEIGREIMFFFFGRKNDKPKEWPSWIIKTDETRCENIPWILENKGIWVKTEKLDGTSCSYGVKRIKKNKFDFAVCSRNVRQMDRDQQTYHETNIYWELSDKYGIEEMLKKYAIENNYDTVVLQGEGVGNVQGNPYKLEENNLYVFNLIINGVRTSTLEMVAFCEKNGLLHVPVIDFEQRLPETMEDLKLEADGFSEINPNVKREGFVYRSQDGKQSFKNVSREYLLKHS